MTEMLLNSRSPFLPLKDGTTFIGEVSSKKITYNGRVARVAGIRDITARKQAEDALRQSEARNRAFLRAIPDLIFRFSRDGTYLDCQAENISDLLAPASELIGKKLQDIIPEPVAQLFLQQMEQALATGVTQTLEYELPIHGNRRYWESRIVVCGEDMIRCTVADKGVGMSKEMCDHLFQLYFRGQDAQGHQGHRPYTGLGLGLYLCRQIIMAHDGELGVNSRQGVGTTFWFTLPLTSNQLSDRSY